MSRGFACALGGIAVTAFSWISPWAWPAWPALALMRYVFESTFADLPYATRGAIVVLLIVVNVAVWAAIIYAITVLIKPVRRAAPTSAPAEYRTD
ncbi:MAG: hypothetical protein JWO97_4342 [Acidobacteria bacterium]|nr:hypothetical protein [Acidobacteriota bacterium]